MRLRHHPFIQPFIPRALSRIRCPRLCNRPPRPLFAALSPLLRVCSQVVGCGESGMDIAYRAVLRAASTSLSIKTGFLAVPHDGWGGLPLDTLICNM